MIDINEIGSINKTSNLSTSTRYVFFILKNDAWFNEKYNPELLDLQEKEKKDLAKLNYENFIKKL